MPYIVALDSRVLLPCPNGADVAVALMHLAGQQVYRPRWSEQILDDVKILCRREYPGAPISSIDRYIARFSEGYPFSYDAMVRANPFLSSHEQAHVDLTPYALHTLETAAHGGADAVLTTRPEDFPEELTRGLVVQPVDEFFSGQLELQPLKYAKAFQIWARENGERRSGPTSVAGLIDQLECEAPTFAKEARDRLLALMPMF